MNTIDQDIKQAKVIAELHRGKNGEDGWNEVIGRLALEVERLRAENAAFREGLPKVATNIGNGSLATFDASLDFLAAKVPEEVGIYCSRLRAENAEKSREIERHRSLVSSLKDRISKLETALDLAR